MVHAQIYRNDAGLSMHFISETSIGTALVSPPFKDNADASHAAGTETGAVGGVVGGARTSYYLPPRTSRRGRGDGERDKRVLLQLLDSHSGSEEREWAVKMPSES